MAKKLNELKRVIIESPYAVFPPDRDRFNDYLRCCLLDSLKRGEAPFSAHGLFFRALDDEDGREMWAGAKSGAAWREVADLTAIYGDLAISGLMAQSIKESTDFGVPVEFRSLGEDWWPEDPGEFHERAALEWLRTHPDFEWVAKNRYCWLQQMWMMFGGVTTDAFNWNIREDDSERYIVHKGPIGNGKYVIDIEAVNRRLTELAQE
jgi:hypothetical protein